MKNKVLMVSLAALALTLVVSGCSYGGTQNNGVDTNYAPVSPAPVTPTANNAAPTNITPAVTTTAPTGSVDTLTPPSKVVTPPQPKLVPSNTAVSIQNYSFNPGTLNIKRGTTVTWTNNDPMAHQIKAEVFNSNALSQGQSFSYTFNYGGTFDYSCAIHPSMTGKVIVE